MATHSYRTPGPPPPLGRTSPPPRDRATPSSQLAGEYYLHRPRPDLPATPPSYTSRPSSPAGRESPGRRWAEQREEERWAAATANRLRATLEATKHDVAAAMSAAEADAASAWWRASLERDSAEAASRELDLVSAQARRERAEMEVAVHSRDSALYTAERLGAQLAETRLEASVEATRWHDECTTLRAELEAERVASDAERRHVEESCRSH